jgi:hypothetical protein
MDQRLAIRLAALGLMFLLAAAAGGADERPAGEENSQVGVAPGRSAEDAAVDRLLDQVVAADLGDATLSSLVEFLRELKIDAQFDSKSLEEAGMGPDTALPAMHVGRISLRSLLANMLRSVTPAQFAIRNGKLFITTADKASSEMLTIVYRVDDLIRGKNRAGDDVDDPESLVNIITETIGPTTWDEVGGPGAISSFQGTLVVSQTERIHDEIERALTALRESRAKQEEQPGGDAVWACSAAELAVLRNFSQKANIRADIKFDDLPLDEAVSQIARQFDFPVFIDAVALDEAGIGRDTHVSCDLPQVTPRVALDILLGKLELTYLIKNEVVVVTTRDKASNEMTLAVYPVADLVQTGTAKVGAPRQEFGRLIDVITSSIMPTTWDEVGGPGRIAVSRITSSLAVSATQEVHEQVTRLLASIRQLRTPPAQEAQTSQKVGGPTELITKAYALSQPAKPMELLKEIRAVEPDSWEQTGVHARASGRQLIIRNTRDAHTKIEKALRARNALATGGMGGGMGGMGGGMF